MWKHLQYALVLFFAMTVPLWALTSEQVSLTGVQSGPLQNKTFDSTDSFANITITGTIPGGASYTSPTLTNPTISGAIAGSATWASPGAIGATSPSTARFTMITGTTGFTIGTTPTLTSGTGSPETVVTAPVGSLYLRTNGGIGTTFYIKETGVGNTGWTPFSTSATAWTTPGTIGSGTPNTGAFTTLSVTGQFTSTLTTGTAPLVVSSTTKVTNLNGDLLDGADWAAPLALGSTTPAAITGTTITANTKFVIGAPTLSSGTGSPEGVVTAPVSSLYLRTDGGTGTVIYSKETGVGNVGWVAVSSGTGNFATISLTGQLLSTQATGTPPMVIASTTKVTNLNGDQVDGFDWVTPGAIGSTTPNTGAFTNLTSARTYNQVSIPTYGATIAVNSAAGNIAIITATNNTNFTISNPLTPITGTVLSIMVKNASGGVLGTVTWDTLYKMAAFTKPANGFRRTVTFLYDGTNWVELNCSPEVPN